MVKLNCKLKKIVENCLITDAQTKTDFENDKVILNYKKNIKKLPLQYYTCTGLNVFDCLIDFFFRFFLVTENLFEKKNYTHIHYIPTLKHSTKSNLCILTKVLIC